MAAIGPAKADGTADETQLFTAGGLGIPYVNSKHEAEVEALRLAARGLPVVIVNPSFCFGPDDPKGTSMRLIRRFLLQQIPAYVDGGLNVVDVRDVAEGHLLADLKGEVGERYILGGRNFTLDRLFADLARISGVAAPPLKLPAPARADRRARARARPGSRFRPSPTRCVAAGLWWTYRNAKARNELGFKARPHEDDPRGGGRLAGRGARRPRRCRGGAGDDGDARPRPRAPRRRAAGRAMRNPLARSPRPPGDREPATARSSSTGVRPRPTCSAPAARSSGGCAGSASSTASSGCPTGAPSGPRSRS